MSLIVNRVILFCLERDIPLPKFTDSFFGLCAKVGMKNTTKESKESFVGLVYDIYESEFYNFPKIERCQAIQIQANKYKVNFVNSTIYPFANRQRDFIKLWCKHNKINKRHFFTILSLINGWKIPKPRKKQKDQQITLGDLTPQS